MSESFDGRRSPFDLFGPPASSEDPTSGLGPDLSELMRQEAGDPTVEPGGSIDDAAVGPPLSPGFDAAFDLGEAAPIESTAAAPHAAAGPAPGAPESIASRADPAASRVQSAPVEHGARVVPEAVPEAVREAPPSRPVEDARAPDPVDVSPEPARRAPESRIPDPIAETSAPALVDGKKLWFLRMLLVGNIAMVFVMLVLPHPLDPRTDPAPEAVVGTPPRDASRSPRAAPVDRFDSPARVQGLGLPDEARYERALLLAVDGDFDGACSELQGLLDDAPDLNPAVARLVHAHLAYYLRKAGHLGAALEHERFARQEADRSALPEELLREARAAQAVGDGVAVRRAYAKFLLQQGQLSPDMRALIQEALIEIGDSYRIQAEVGERAAGERDR